MCINRKEICGWEDGGYLLCLQGQGKDARCFGRRRTGTRVGGRALSIQVRGSNARVGVLGSVTERGRQGGAAALVVVSVLAVVDGAINGNSPHGGGIPVAVAVVLLSAVAGCPNIDVAQAISSLREGRKISIKYWEHYHYISIPHSRLGQSLA